MKAYKTLAVLLTYPQPYWLAHLDDIEAAIDAQWPAGARHLRPWFEYATTRDLIKLQEEYVATFDIRAAHSLYLTEHTHGDEQQRGTVLAQLVDRYRGNGLEIAVNELPDFLPLFLEFIARLPEQEAQQEFAAFIPAVTSIRQKLEKAGSPYRHVFIALENLAVAHGTTAPQGKGHRTPQRLLDKARDRMASVFSRRPSP